MVNKLRNKLTVLLIEIEEIIGSFLQVPVREKDFFHLFDLSQSIGVQPFFGPKKFLFDFFQAVQEAFLFCSYERAECAIDGLRLVSK